MPKTLDYRCLLALGACGEQVALFRETFGDGAVSVTHRSVTRARAAGLDVLWLADALSAPARVEYDRVCNAAWAEYDRACAPAWAEYDRACAPAWAEYARVCNAARAEYDRVRAPAWAEYDRACAPAWAEYARVCDAALADTWNA